MSAISIHTEIGAVASAANDQAVIERNQAVAESAGMKDNLEKITANLGTALEKNS